jgi:SPX domain protein involved in polyphosphate accumulation
MDPLILRLSNLYDTVRTGGKREAAAPPSGSSQSFVRRTTKYWVHPDNVTEVKIHILKHLPVLIFQKTGQQEADPAITSIYLDNDSFDLYLGRLEKTQGAEAHRLRWYGNMNQTEIFVERKTHQEDWTGESSVKARFTIKEKHVNDFLNGKYSMEHTLEKARAKGEKSDKEIDEALKLSSEIQDTVLKKGLKPMVGFVIKLDSYLL